MIYKALLFGSRHWDDPMAIQKVIESLIQDQGTTNLLIIEGGAPGADTQVKEIGHQLNVHVAEIDALWNSRHQGAGPQRNKMMRALDPNEGVCFHANLARSKGSAGMKELLEEVGIPVRVITG